MNLGNFSRFNDQLVTWLNIFWVSIFSSRRFMLMFIILCITVWTFIAFTVGYYYSQHSLEKTMIAFEQMSKRYNLPYERLSWDSRFSALQRWVNVSDKASEEMKRLLYEKNQSIKELEEHLYFFRSVVAPEEKRETLSIFSVNLQRLEEENAYQIEVVLRNDTSKKEAVKGIVKVLIKGSVNPQAMALVRADLLDEDIRFSFKYFQRLKGILRLPESFKPDRLSVVIDSNKFDDIEEIYAWEGLLEKSR